MTEAPVTGESRIDAYMRRRPGARRSSTVQEIIAETVSLPLLAQKRGKQPQELPRRKQKQKQKQKQKHWREIIPSATRANTEISRTLMPSIALADASAKSAPTRRSIKGTVRSRHAVLNATTNISDAQGGSKRSKPRSSLKTKVRTKEGPLATSFGR